MKRIANIYNPQSQAKEELIKNFVIRQKEFDTLFKAISTTKMSTPEQHYLIQGQRGMGKTTLIMRLYYEVQNDQKLSNWLVPVLFSEEQYGIRKLYKLWEHIAKYLEDHYAAFAGLFDRMDDCIATEDYEEVCLDLLLDALKKEKKKLILLMDNFGDLLEKFSLQERQRLREIFITTPELRLIGGSSRMLESTFSHEEPFYEFFRIIQLEGLNKTEVTALLRNLGELDEEPKMEQILKEEPGRIESLRRLSGGVPRTMVLLYEIFIDEASGDSFKTLHSLVDRVSPLYKHRMDELKPNQQEIVEVIALNWDALPVKEIAQKTRMESNVVSAQLTQLERNNIIDKVKTTNKNNLYRISERFFNIWYIMRHGRKRDHKRVKWLVEFFREWCIEDEIQLRTAKHIEYLKKGCLNESHAFHITETLAQLLPPGEDQDSLISITRDFLGERNSEWANSITPSDMQLVQKAGKSIVATGKIDDALLLIKKIRNQEFRRNLNFIFTKIVINKYAKQLLPILFQNVDFMLILFQFIDLDIESLRSEGKEYMERMAISLLRVIKFINSGILNNSMELYEMAEELLVSAENIDDPKFKAEIQAELAMLYHFHLYQFEKAEKCYLKAISLGAQNLELNLALLYQFDLKDHKKAEKYYLIEVEKKNPMAMCHLAQLYEANFNQPELAHKYYEMAVEHNYPDAVIKIALDDFNNKVKSNKSLKLVQKLEETDQIPNIAFTKAVILLWHNKFQSAFEFFPQFIDDAVFTEEPMSDNIEEIMLLLIAKEQYQFAYRLFEESNINLKDRYKPVYYALMHFMRDEYPNEILKMGPELEETVSEVIAKIKQMAIDYA